MNERIKELDKQAKLWAMDNTNFPISSHIPSGYTEKFAELIAQDCISQIALIGVSNFENDDIMWAVERSIEIIKERFMEIKE